APGALPSPLHSQCTGTLALFPQG
ncbi:RNA pyrophosphohydrolase, partial [Streptomyces sp. WAC 06725]